MGEVPVEVEWWKRLVEGLEGAEDRPWTWKALFAARFWSMSRAALYQASGELSAGQLAVMVATAA